MAHKNYSKMSTQNKEQDVELTYKHNPEAEPIAKVEEVSMVDGHVDVKLKPTFEYGIVEGCEKLNVRKAPNINSEVITVIPKGTNVLIYPDKSTKDFYKVSNDSGNVTFNGYCMKQFIARHIYVEQFSEVNQ